MAQTRHILNNKILAIFSPTTTIPAMLHYSGFENWPIFSTKWYVIAFLHFLYFLQSGTHFVSVHFMNNITHSASLPPPPSPLLNHIANRTHHLATIRGNNSFSSLSHSSNSGCVKGPKSEGVLWGLTLFWSFAASSKHRNMERDKCASNHWFPSLRLRKLAYH